MKNYQITNNKYLVNRLRSIILASLVFVTLLTVFAPLSVLAVESTFTTSLTTTGLSTLPPPVPTNFLATAVSSSQIDLSWTASVANFYSIAGYRIFRDSIFLATTSSTVYSDTGLTELTAYSYTIEAFDTIFQMSGQSATTSATTTATPTPTPVSGGGSGSSGTSINISNIKIIPGIDQAEISFDTNVEAQTKVRWGFSKDFEIGSLQNLFYGKKHTQMINGLVGGLTYQVRITASDSRGRLAYKDLYFTTILPDTEYKQIPNPTDFLATAREKDIKLTWTNPTDPRFNDVRIVRAEGFYPIDQFDGIPLYEGDGESFVDTSAKPGVIYYYAIFARDRAMNYSSGALAQARIAIPGEVVVPPVVDPFANLPQAKEVDPMIQALTLADFEFIQDGKNLEVIGETIAIHGDKNLTIRLKYNKVPEILKTVAFTLQDPSDPSKAFPFLLRINSDKTYYEATIGALGRSGRYSMSVAILDYENNGLKRINGTLAALAFSAPFLNFAKDFDILGLLILLLFIILIILAIILLRRWVYYHPEFDHKPAYSTHTNSPSNNASATMRKFIASVIVITISALSIISFVGSVYASFNPEINYQGKLVSSTNSIVPDGNYNIRFKLYTSLALGSPIWTETWCNTSDCAGTGTGNDIRIPIVNGLFSIMLGSTTAFTGVDFDQPLYLSVEIGGSGATAVWDGEMSPRKILGAVPAAFYAGTSSVALSANTLDGLDSAQFFRNDTQNATSSSSTFLNIIQTGAGKIAEFFGSASQSVLALLSNGNVGIGTSTPSSKLSLVGGNFTHTASGTPTLAASYDPSGPGNTRGVYVSGKYVYLADGTSGFQIIDISNPVSPTIIGTYNTSGTAYGVYVSGKYAYVADSDSGLQIIDILNPSSPTITGTYNTSGTAYNVYVSGKYAYVADDVSGLQIIDISNPASPTLTSTYDTSGTAYGVYVSGKYAYVADDASGLQIIDISNPANPTLIGTYDTTGSAKGVYISGKYAYIADGSSGLQIINISNPSSLTLTGTYDTSGSALGVYISNNYAYVADDTSGFQIIDISNPVSPILTGTFDTSGRADEVYVSGKYAYVADGLSGLRIFDINGIETPSLYAGNMATNALTVTENVDIGNSLYVRNSLNVGMGGIFTDGVLSAIGTSSSYIAGNLGLGTTSPNWKLSVAGIGSFDDYVRASYFIATSTTATSTFAGGLSVAGSTGLNVLQNGNVGIGGVSSSTLYIAGSAGSGNGDAETSLYVNGGQGGTDGMVGGRGSDIFLVAGNGGDGAMFPGGGGNIYLSPGIGGLGSGGGDRGSVIVNGNLHSTYSNGYAIHGSLSDDSSYGAGVYGESSINGGSGVYGQSNNAGGYAVYANQSNSSGYAIYSAGGKNYFENNLGLGTTSPNWKLSVAGIGSFDDYVRASYFTATSTTATSTFAGGLSVAGVTGLNILQNGNIGIGTSSPSSKLTLAGGNFTHTASGNPTLAGTYDTGGGVNNIYVSGKYAYLANGVAGLKIINISNQADPTLMGTYDTSINANNVYVSGKYAFVADDNSSLKIIDISNPASPTLTGTYNTSSNPTDVYISGKYAYVTDYSAGLYIIDISNPANPTLAGTYNTSGSAYGVYVSSKYAYVADDSSGLQIIDISNPSSPTLVGTYDTSNFATGVYVSGKYAYVADYFSGLNIIDISNPSTPTLVGTYDTSGSAIGVYISGKYAYVADNTSGLQIIDISNPASPTLTGTYNTGSSVNGVHVSGKYAYIADGDSGLQIIDINGIETPSLYAGNINTNALTVTENVDIGNSLYVRNGLNIGQGGIFTDGVLGVAGTSSSYIAGNLGLGTTSPNWKLSVAGQGSFDDYVRASYFTATSTTATSTFPNLSLTRMLFGSDYLTDITGTGLSISNGALSVTGASILGAANMLAGFDASGNLTSTSSPQVAYINATSTTNESYFAGGVNTSGTTGGYYIDNTLILQASSTNRSTLVGIGAGASLLAGGENNTALGYQALNATISGDENTAVGYLALKFNTTGSYNIALGNSALYSNTTGSSNVALGYGSISSNTTGSNNTAQGMYSLLYNSSATNTTAIGYGAAYGDGNYYNNQGGVYLGYRSGYLASTGSDYNTMLGYESGYGVTTGANNILLGYRAGYSGTNLTTGSNNIIIGHNIGATSTTMTRGLNIGNLIFGTNLDGTGTTLSTGKIGIGTTSPNWKLSVAGIGSFDDYVRAGYFIATSTTASIFPYASTTALTISGTNGLQLATGLNGLLQAVNGLVQSSSTLSIAYGGTGTSTTPTYGQLLMGDGAGNYSLTGTSTLGILASSAIGIGTQGFIPYYAANEQALTATSSLFISQSSFIGIGTTTPTSALSVFSASGPQFQLAYDKDNYLTTSISSSGGVTMAVNGTAGGFSITNPQPSSVLSGTGTNAPIGFAVTAGTGGNSLDTNIGVGGIGGGIQLTAGVGGTAIASTFSETGGAGGAVSITGGLGGSASSPAVDFMSRVAGIGGTLTLAGGAGGNASNGGLASSNIAGAGGAFILKGGAGGDATGATTNNGGAGGSMYLAGGAGGTGSSANGSAGNLYLGYDSSSVIGNVYFGNQGASYIGSTGNFGIGTTSPSNKLGVSGFIDVDGTTGGYKIDNRLILQASSTNGSIMLGQSAGNSISSSGNYNTMLGYEAGYNTSTGDNALYAGYRAGYYATSSLYSTYLGYEAGRGNTGTHQMGDYNTAVGYRALYVNTTGIYNTAIGYRTLASNTTGERNTATGYGALELNTTGNYNIAFGFNALNGNTTGSYNNAQGYQSLFYNTTGSYNATVGHSALLYNTSATNTTAIGYNAGAGTATYSSQGGTYLGYQAGYSAGTGGDYNTMLGYEAGYSTSIGDNALYAGYRAGYYATSSLYSTYLGYEAGRGNTGTHQMGDYNTAIGYKSLNANTTGLQNVAIGYMAMDVNTTGYDNFALGTNALGANTTGIANVAIGTEALQFNVSGQSNVGIGKYALRFNTGNVNTAIGNSALYRNTSGINNVAIGPNAGQLNTTGASNIFIGASAGYYNASATNTTAVGHSAGIGTASYNAQGGTYLGFQAGYSAGTGGDYNTLLGYQSGYNVSTGKYNIIIGQNVNATSSDSVGGLNIGNVLFGTGMYTGSTVSATPTTDGKIGIGTTSPYAKLSVAGDVVADYFHATSTTATSTFAGGMRVAGTGGLTVLQNGYVGIGNVSPTRTLSVNGSIELYSADPFYVINGTNSSSGQPRFQFQDNGTNKFSVGLRNSDDSFHITTGSFLPDSASRISVSSTGNVGLSTTSPFTKLSVAGSVYLGGNLTATGTVTFDNLTASTGAGSICLSATKELVYNAGSDACLPSLRSTKHDITNLSTSSLSTLNLLTPVSFIYNQGDNRTRYGFIAEDVSQIDTHLATYNDKGEISGIDDRALIALAIGSIKELDVRSNAIASSTVDLGSSLTELRDNMANLASSSNKTLAEAIVALDIKVQALATSTADLISSTTIALASNEDFISKIATTSANILKSDSSFIDSIATAVKNIIASAGEWVVDRFTARIAYVTRVEAETVAISKGMEIVDQSNGSIWCVTIKNGDWNKVLGSCANIATSTPVVTPSPEPTPTPSVTPVTDLPTPTPTPTSTPIPTPIEIIDNNSTTTVTFINTTPTPTPVATSTTVVEVVETVDSVPTPTPSITPVSDLPTPTPEATPVPVETVSPELVSNPVTEPSSQPVSEPSSSETTE
jgi:hypothetical protein